MPIVKSCYGILGVDEKASIEDIKSAYRKLVMQYHPDRNKSPDAEEKFKEISEAYAVLSNRNEHQQCGQFGHDGCNYVSRYSGYGVPKWVRNHKESWHLNDADIQEIDRSDVFNDRDAKRHWLVWRRVFLDLRPRLRKAYSDLGKRRPDIDPYAVGGDNMCGSGGYIASVLQHLERIRHENSYGRVSIIIDELKEVVDHDQFMSELEIPGQQRVEMFDGDRRDYLKEIVHDYIDVDWYLQIEHDKDGFPKSEREEKEEGYVLPFPEADYSFLKLHGKDIPPEEEYKAYKARMQLIRGWVKKQNDADIESNRVWRKYKKGRKVEYIDENAMMEAEKAYNSLLEKSGIEKIEYRMIQDD